MENNDLNRLPDPNTYEHDIYILSSVNTFHTWPKTVYYKHRFIDENGNVTKFWNKNSILSENAIENKEENTKKLELVSRAIREDKLLKEYYDKKHQVYSMSKYDIKLVDGELIQIWSDEVTKLASEIDELIKLRIQQIINFYK